ncbi:MAG TPA: restriction endonuclease subunit S [Pseudomonadales bacterium]
MSEVAIEKNGLPEGWEWSTLGEVCEKPQYGWTTKATDNGNLRLLRTTDITKGQITWETVPFCSEEPEDKEKYLLRDGDIVVSRAGSVGVSYLLTNPEPSVFASYLIRFKPYIDKKYVYYFLQSPAYWNSISEKSAGIALQNVNASKLKDIIIPVSPPDQQKRIVAKTEELFSHIDAGIAALKQAKQLLKQYRQSVLKAAVTGELTKEWREQNKSKLEPASQLLERILTERRQKWEEQQLEQFKAKAKMPRDDKWKEKYKEPLLPEFEHISDVPEIPDNWEWVSVSQLTSFVKDGPHYSPKYAEEGIPFITGGNVRPHGVDFDNCKYITQELHEELSKRCKPELNDILYTKGGTTGIARVNTFDIEFNVWVHVAVLRLVNIKDITPFFIQHALNSLLCYAQSQKYTHGVGNQDLGLTRMIKICLALPPVEEQKEIVKLVDEKMDYINRIEEQVEQLLVMGDKNKQSILASAFSGKI